MRFLFLGDMVGKTGRTAVWERLPGLIHDFKLDFVVVNGENAAGGFGITEDIFLETVNAGADVVTTGNHVWDQKEAVGFAGRHDQFLRPANYPAGTPGRGATASPPLTPRAKLLAEHLARLGQRRQARLANAGFLGGDGIDQAIDLGRAGIGARDHRLQLAPAALSHFYLDPQRGRSGLVLGYGNTSASRYPLALRTLNRLIVQHRRGSA